MDTMFGTRYHTVGAELQLPRKVPMRVEPKSFFGELRLVKAAGGRTASSELQAPRGERVAAGRLRGGAQVSTRTRDSSKFQA
jgi:hypothetical protein